MGEFEKITSRDNQRLVTARKVRDGNVDGRIFIEGRRLVQEALRSGMEIDECFIADNLNDAGLIDAVGERTLRLAEVPARLFSSIADTDNSQGIILIAERPKDGSEKIQQHLLPGKTGLPIALFLKEINNPSNLGAVLRTAEAAGVAGVIVSENSADVYSPKALRASMGSAFRLPIWENADFESVLTWARAGNLATTGTDISAAKTYDQLDWSLPRLLIFGSEAHGLTAGELESVAETVLIPMANDVESLNLAVSAGIILFEAKRQNATG